MKCRRCAAEAIILSPPRCKRHFLEQFERRVAATIKEHRLLTKGDKVLVAASGGKDSTTTLFLLRKLGYDVSALAIDEGIKGYRNETLSGLRRFCKKEKISLKIVSFKEHYGNDLDTVLRQHLELHPCTVCGTFRRQLLNKHAHGYDIIATGHNADDEAQSVLMNLCRANIDLFPRGGPLTTSRGKGFVKRIKPLYFLMEKEIMLYALLNNLAPGFNECPYAVQAYRGEVRDALNAYEEKHPGAKVRVLQHYLATKKKLAPQRTTTQPCTACGEPSQQGVCKACRLVEQITAA